MKLVRVTICCLILFVVAGCSKQVMKDSGVNMPTSIKIEDCIDLCKRDNNACHDSAASERTEGRQFGAAAQCDRTLKTCFDRCRTIDPAYGEH